MEIFDFHLHPGYDFHGPALDYTAFTQPLKQLGIVGCAGSYTSADCNKRPVADYADLIPAYNRAAWEFHDRDPAFFTPGIHIHPAHPDMSAREIRVHYEKGGILVGELVPYLMGWNYKHENLYPLLSLIRDLNMVVSIHPSRDFTPVARIMDNVPGLKLVVAHLGGYELYDQILQLMKTHETVYTDLSAHGTAWDGLVADAVRQVGSQRILYGSDYPGYGAKPFIDIVLEAPIPAEAKENILYRNATTLLGKI